MEEEQLKKHTLGICAMKKKIHSPHMQQILDFIREFNDFDLIEFKEEMIFNKEVEEWPIVESMIVFYSTGFPYYKVLKYINLRKPFLPNDFEIQKVFWDRIKVMNLLKENNIPIPNGIIVEREPEIDGEEDKSIELNTSQEIEEMIQQYNEEYNEGNKPKAPNLNFLMNNDNRSEESNSVKLDEVEKIITKNEKGEEVTNELEEYDEYIVYNGKKIMKPFVEKPKNGDDHNIYIYYPMNHGGGQTRLFRKHKDLSSLYYPNINKIRRDKSYLYEEYLQTDGFDIKVYTVGENYAHAEERKSPSLDGKVERNKGKEVRYPVNLTPNEKNIARKIVQIFKQNICGFDILRSKGVSYVCDVNGWSFVKGNRKYFQDCAILLRNIILSVIDPGLLTKHPINIPNPPVYKEMILDNKGDEITDELRSVVAVFRHADRSPKQKLKVLVDHPDLLGLFDLYKHKEKEKEKENDNGKPKEIKLKKPQELLNVLKIVINILKIKGINGDEVPSFKLDNFYIKLFQIKLILERNLNFEGLTRKIQLRPIEWNEIIDPNTSKKSYKITKALLIMKWGGHITHSGIEQAKILGQTFRTQFYPSSEKGEGLLRLHNTYRHDLKCYSSEEGRCLKSAAAFLQGLLQLEGNLIQIIYSMVWKDEKINKLLDVDSTSIETNRKEVKFKLNEFCNYNGHLKEKYTNYVAEDDMKLQKPFINLAEKIDNFHSKMMDVHKLLGKIIDYLSTKIDVKEKEKEDKTYFIKSKKSTLSRYDSYDNIKTEKKKSKEEKTLKGRSDDIKSSLNINDSNRNASKANKKIFFDCEEEKVILIYKRYFKLYNDFYDSKKNKFDISKIPDIYDNIKYDIIHNRTIIGETAIELYQEITILAEFVMPLEYGIKIDEKIKIGIKFIKPLLNKIYNDLLWVLNFDGSSSFISNQSNNSLNLNLSDNEDSSMKDLQSLESQERTYFGLDEEKLDKGEIKSAWRHVKTKIYFTSQSHLYSLLNTLIYSMNAFLIQSGLGENNPILSVFDLDYCSHIVFRLFENYKVDKKSKKRYRIEIVVSPGADKNITKYDDKHLIPLDTWLKLNDHLTLPDIQKYFNFILG